MLAIDQEIVDNNEDVILTMHVREYSNKEGYLKVFLKNIITGLYCMFL